MSIYSTLWSLKFPRSGDDHTGCDWISVTAQGVRAIIGTPSPGYGYEDGDPYAEFLPPALELPAGDDGHTLRAVVFVMEGTRKGTGRCGQEYDSPLLVLTGQQYAAMNMEELYECICGALRGDRPRCIGEHYTPHGVVRVLFADGSSEEHRSR